MNNQSYNTILEYIAQNDLSAFTDRVDASIEESLAEYGFIRNPVTGKVLYTRMNYDTSAGTETVEIRDTNVSPDEVRWALIDMMSDDGYFDYIGSNKATELGAITNDNLAGSIQSLQSYYGTFWQPSN